MRPLMMVSATAEKARMLETAGPLRDFVELARATGGSLRYGPGGDRNGLRAKLFGPHVRQAWAAAGELDGQGVFADGEHNGLPLLLFAALRRRRTGHVSMLGHLVTRPWKLAMLAVATRLGSRGTLFLHSVEQAQRVRRWVGGRWQVRVIPYQADTHFWTPGSAVQAPGDLPLIVAVGSEHRDYETLAEAVRDLPVRVVIAAGSHWARSTAGATSLPANVEYLVEPLDFVSLRELYRSAAVVVVPLHDVVNQSGITTMLEAMSCARPLVVTATRGQRECVAGPLVNANGGLDHAATSDRGPAAIGLQAPPVGCRTGLYVPPGDSGALRAAIARLIERPREAAATGAAARASVESSFSVERFVEALARDLLREDGPALASAPSVLEAS